MNSPSNEATLAEVDGLSSLLPPAKRVKRRRQAELNEPPASEGSAASTLTRALEVLKLFTTASPLLRMDDVISKLDYTRSTAYRYVKELVDANLLTPVWGNRYMLGSRILELDRLLELTDPLYRAGRVVLRPLRREDSVFLLQGLYRDRVLCIHREGPEMLYHQGRRVSMNRARGVPFPLFRGAASLVVLASLSPHRIRQTFLSASGDIAEYGLGQTWPEFKTNLAAIRRRGYALSRTGSPLLLSLAVPILLPQANQVIGSLSHITPHDLPSDQETRSLDMLQQASRDIAAEYWRLMAEHADTSAGRTRAGRSTT